MQRLAGLQGALAGSVAGLVFGLAACLPFSPGARKSSQSNNASFVDTAGPDASFASQCELVTITQPNTVMYTVQNENDCSNVAHPEPLGVGSVLENIGADALPEPPLTGEHIVLKFTPDASLPDYLKVCVAKTQVTCGDVANTAQNTGPGAPSGEAPQGTVATGQTGTDPGGPLAPSPLPSSPSQSSAVSLARCPSTFVPKPRTAGSTIVCPRGYTLIKTQRTWQQPWKDPDFFERPVSDTQTAVGRIDSSYGYACARPGGAVRTAKGYFMAPIRAFEVPRMDRDWHMECKYVDSACRPLLGCG